MFCLKNANINLQLINEFTVNVMLQSVLLIAN